MNELLKYKRKITFWTIVLIVICVISVALLLIAANSFNKDYMSIILLITLVAQPILAYKLGLMGNKITMAFIKNEEDKEVAQQINDEQYEKEVDKKIKEATETTFNIDEVLSSIGQTDDWKAFGDKLLYALSKQIDMAVGLVFKYTADDEFESAATFAYYNDEPPHNFKLGEGISGQVAKDQKAMFLNELPSKSLMIISGLGQIEVNNLAIIPILKDNNAIGVIEIATFKPFENGFINKIDNIANAIGSIAPTN